MLRLVLLYTAAFLALIYSTNAIRSLTSVDYVSTRTYTTDYFTQAVDHFSFTNNDVYRMKYLVNRESWSAGDPIYFYAGNEGDIELFCENTGNMWDIVKEEGKGMLLFAEHRYYGNSVPYGSKKKPSTNMAYLTSEQALADYAVFLRWIRDTWEGAKYSPVVVFGGSYGGMLAAWMRIKYPHLVVGAIAASAPIWEFQDVTPCDSYNRIVTKTFARYGDLCTDSISKSWTTIDSIGKTDDGKNFLTSTFQLCHPVKNQSDIDDLKAWLETAWSNIAMVEYPYPTNFLAPLPAWPIKSVCAPLNRTGLSGRPLMVAMWKAVSVFYNYTGQVPHCFNTVDPGSSGGRLGDQGWNYQACTEMIMPLCSDTMDMFENVSWNLTSYLDGCMNTYKVRGKPYWVMTNYLGKMLNQTSNIVFSNGLLDPWHGGGVLQSASDTVVAVLIKDGAHHLDLRSSNPADTASVKQARILEGMHMKRWISDYYRSVQAGR